MMRGGGSGRGSGGRRSGKGGGNPLALVVLALWLLTLVVAPVISRMLAMAVSRKREFLADATGAQFTRNPLALAGALEKLDAAQSPTRSITRGAAHLCIVDPNAGHVFRARRVAGRRAGLASTDQPADHPPPGHGLPAGETRSLECRGGLTNALPRVRACRPAPTAGAPHLDAPG